MLGIPIRNCGDGIYDDGEWVHDGLFGKGLMTLKPDTYLPEFAEKALPIRTLQVVQQITRAFRAPIDSPPSGELLRWHKKHVFLRNE